MDLILYYVMLVVVFLAGIALDRYFLHTKRYDGNLEVSEHDTSQIHQLEITTEPEKLQTQKSVVFRVKKVPSE